MTNIPEKLTGFRYWCYKVLPLVYDDSLSYYELLCKVVKKLNETIENTNQLNENVQELLNAFNQLQSYVANYFDNLDVQEEINHKLDQMVEDGDFDRIISRYITYNITRVFNTTAELQAHNEFVSGQYVQSLGFSTVGDGGASTFIIVPNTNPLAARFGFTTDTDGLTALPVALSDDFNIAVFGAVPNQENSDDVRTATKAQLEKSIDFCKYYNKNLYIGKGYYALDGDVLIDQYNNASIKNYGTIFVQPTPTITAAFIFKGCGNLTIENKGSIFSSFDFNTAQAASFYNARLVKTSSNLQCFNIQGCNNFKVNGGNYSYFEYVAVTQLNYNDDYKIGAPPSGATAEEKTKYRYSTTNPTGWQDNDIPDNLRSHNITIENIACEFVFMPFYHEHVHNLTLKDNHILAYSGAGRFDHIVYTSQCVYKCFILDNNIENDNLLTWSYEGNVYLLGCWVAFNLRNGFHDTEHINDGYLSDTIDEAYIYNNILNDWTNCYISALGETKIYSANNVINFSSVISATNDPNATDKRNRRAISVADNVEVISNNDIFYNPTKYGTIVQSFKNGARLNFENCSFNGFTQIGEGTLTENDNNNSFDYSFTNCTFNITNRLFYIANQNTNSKPYLAFTNNKIVSDFIGTSTLFTIVTRSETPCILIFTDNYCKNTKETGGASLTFFDELQTDNNINISRNTLDNYSNFLNAELLGATTFINNIRMRNNKTYNSDTYLSIIDTASTIYIDSVNGDDLNNGATSSTAFKTIAAALDKINKFKSNINIMLLDAAEQTLPAESKFTDVNINFLTPQGARGTITTNNAMFYNSSVSCSNIDFSGALHAYNCMLDFSNCTFNNSSKVKGFNGCYINSQSCTYRGIVQCNGCSITMQSCYFYDTPTDSPFINFTLCNARFLTSTTFGAGSGTGASMEFTDSDISLFGAFTINATHKTTPYKATRSLIKTAQSVIDSLTTQHGNTPPSNSTSITLLNNATLGN